jgi:hypothetical protein
MSLENNKIMMSDILLDLTKIMFLLEACHSVLRIKPLSHVGP